MERYIAENELPNDFTAALDNRICFSMIGLGLTEMLNPDGHMARIKNIRKFLATPRYRNAYKKLDMQYLPIHWRMFFAFCKHRMAFSVYILLIAMKKIIEK